MTFRDLKKIVSSEVQPSIKYSELKLEGLRDRPFWIWDVREHKSKDLENLGSCCFNHIVGLPTKNGIEMSIFDYEKIVYDSLQQSRYIWIKKATGLGITEFFLRYMVWLCLKDDKLKGSQMCIVTGPRIDLAINLIYRIKQLLRDKLTLVFNARETRTLYNEIKLAEEPFGQHDKYSSFQEELSLDNFLDYFVGSRKDSLTSIAEYSLCVSIMNKDEIINKQVDRSHRLLGSILHVTHWTYIFHILKRMVRSYIRDEKLNKRLFDNLYLDLEKFLYNDYMELTEICPLLNFDISGHKDLIALSDFLSIRRISNIERSQLVERLAFYEIGLNDIINMKCAIEYKFKISKGFDIAPEIQDGEYPSNLKSVFTAVITALRLYKEGTVGAHMFLQKVTLDLPFQLPSLVGLHVLGLETDIGLEYILDKKEKRNFMKFWTKYMPILIGIIDFKVVENSPYKNIKRALNRFNSAYHKKTSEDKYLDWIISFETLFSMKNDPTDSITHKLALRGSRFIRKPIERKELYSELKTAYNGRSKIVHGDDIVLPKINIRSHMSKCLIKYLDELISGRSHDSILESVDFD